MADAKKFLCAFYISFLVILLSINRQKDNFTPDDGLLEVSEYILAQNWERRSPELGIYGLSCVVYKGGYPVEIQESVRTLYNKMSHIPYCYFT